MSMNSEQFKTICATEYQQYPFKICFMISLYQNQYLSLYFMHNMHNIVNSFRVVLFLNPSFVTDDVIFLFIHCCTPFMPNTNYYNYYYYYYFQFDSREQQHPSTEVPTIFFRHFLTLLEKMKQRIGQRAAQAKYSELANREISGKQSELATCCWTRGAEMTWNGPDRTRNAERMER